MNQEQKIIPLNFNRDHLEELYHLKEYRNLFVNRRTRGYLFTVIACASTFLISIFYSIFSNKLIVLSVVSFLGLLFSLIILYLIARPFKKYKRSIVDWIDLMETYSNQKLILTENSFALIQDETETIEKWETISNVKIAPNYISIKGAEQFIFPKASMAENDFEHLSSFVSRLMKNGL